MIMIASSRFSFLRTLPAAFGAVVTAWLTIGTPVPAAAEEASKPTVYDTPESAAEDPDFLVQGEYSGSLMTDDGERKVGVQVIALGAGKFRAVGHMGGLPGDGWDGEERTETDSATENGTVVFHRPESGVKGVLAKGGIRVVTEDGTEIGSLNRIERKSPTLGEKPPAGALVLFDGSNADAWHNGRITKDGLLKQGVASKEKFGDLRVHIEFRLPFKPTARGQARGNSGIYLQGRYEVQMLDSFGLSGEHNECGGIYTVRKPDVNMCLPPLQWQTYDIDFTAAEFDQEGKMTAKPKLTVFHNGVKIHENVEVGKSTTASPNKEKAGPGPITLQNHGNPVRYRNIWVVGK